MTTVAERYVDAVNAADIAKLMALFAEDAVLNHPSGTFVGTSALQTFYETVVFAGQAILTIDRQVIDGPVQLLQVSATSPLAGPDAPKLYAADIFVVQDDKIDVLDIYYR